MALTKIPSSLLDTSGGFDLQGNITLGDNEKIIFGNDTDLQLYHDGTHSYVRDTGTGNLRLQGTNLYLQNEGGTKNYLGAINSGAVTLYFDNDAKIATSSTGATVTGTLTVTGDLDITGDINSYNVTDLDVTDQTITLGAGQTEANSGGSGIIIDGSNASLLWNETSNRFDLSNDLKVGAEDGGQFSLEVSGGATGTAEGGELRLNTAADYDGTYNHYRLDVYEDDLRIGRAGTTDITLDSSGNVGIGTSSPTADLSVGSTSTSSGDVHLRTTKTAFSITPSNTDAGGILFDLGWVNGGQGPMKFGINGSEKMRIDSSGRLLAGKDSVGARLAHTLARTGAFAAEIIQQQTSAGASVLGLTYDGAAPNNTTDYFIYAIDTAGIKHLVRANGDGYFAGKVGIGTTGPSEKLEVNGKIRLGGMRLANNDSGRIGLNRNPDDGSTVISGLQRFQINGPYSGGDYLDFQSYNSSGTYTGSFYLNAGKVGIGTSQPQMGLHVGSGTQSTSALPGIGIANGGSSYSFYSASDGTKQYIAGIDHNITYTKAGSLSNHSHAIVSNNTIRLFCKNDGFLGIGDVDPDSTVHIKNSAAGGPQIHMDDGTNSAFINFDGTNLQLATQRDMVDGTWHNTAKSWGGINIRGKTDGSEITMNTAPNANTAPTTRFLLNKNGSLILNSTAATAGKTFEIQDRASGYSSFWVDDNNREYGRGITNAYGLLGGNSTQYDGDGATYPVYGFGGAADNASNESVDFWIKSSTSEWQPMVFFCIGASTNASQTGQTAGWALIRATHYNNGVSTSILDSGGGGTFSLSVISGSLDSNDVMQVRISYSGGQNRATLSVWCNTYQHIRGAQRA